MFAISSPRGSSKQRSSTVPPKAIHSQHTRQNVATVRTYRARVMSIRRRGLRARKKTHPSTPMGKDSPRFFAKPGPPPRFGAWVLGGLSSPRVFYLFYGMTSYDWPDFRKNARGELVTFSLPFHVSSVTRSGCEVQRQDCLLDPIGCEVFTNG